LIFSTALVYSMSIVISILRRLQHKAPRVAAKASASNLNLLLMHDLSGEAGTEPSLGWACEARIR